MADISKIQVPGSATQYNIKDAQARRDIEGVKADLGDCALISTGNLIANVVLTNDYIVSPSTGAIVSSSQWNATDYVPLRAGEEYKILNVSVSAFAFYDINKKFIDLKQNASVCQSNKLLSSFILPDGIFYGRFSIANSSIGYAFLCAYKLPQNGFTIDSKLVSLTDEAFSGLVANVTNMCQNSVLPLDPRMYEHGMIESSTGAFNTYRYASRAKSKFNQIYPFDIKITPKNGASIFVLIYNADGTFVPSGKTYTTNPLVVPANSPFMLNLAYTQDATIESICEKVTIEKLKEAVPYYYFDNNYIQNKVDAIINKSPLDGLQFAFLTDVHCRDNAGQSPYLIKYLKKYTNSVPFVVFGGDAMVTAVPDGVAPLDDARTWQTWMDIMGKPAVYQAQGNHDYLVKYYDDGVQTWYNAPLSICRQLLLGNLENTNIVNAPGKTWFYVNIPTAKTRIIFLNDYDTTRNDGVFYGYNGISAEQVRWVVENALDTDGIRVIFVSHQTYDANMQGENQSQFVGFQNLFKAIANHTNFSYGALQKDFTNSNIKFVAHLCGHMHADASNVNNGVLTIQSTCDGLYGSGRTAGTITEQAFDVVTVDYSNSKLYTTRIGAGNDREFDI